MQLDVIMARNYSSISDDYKKFATEKSQCQACSLFSHYSQVCQSEGNASNPTFVFVGESPGSEEVSNVRPLIGRSGQILRAELRKYPKVFTKQNTLLTNVLQCRPPNSVFPEGNGMWTTKPGNAVCVHKDASSVVNHCVNKWLKKELGILKPKIIVTLGKQALRYVRGENIGITEYRGSWKFLAQYNAWCFATYHPSYVLRCQDDANKQYVKNEFEQDFQKLATSWHAKAVPFVQQDTIVCENDMLFIDYVNSLIPKFEINPNFEILPVNPGFLATMF